MILKWFILVGGVIEYKNSPTFGSGLLKICCEELLMTLKVTVKVV